ncbi:uncharacterized protein BDV14DRAFT_107573 [Aspergillus stella-maris]|uniref:uncharacterized protein n=1 Tax=Aspergillus stella-maris TaxID=1810926 RepID=UPI003CCCAC7A
MLRPFLIRDLHEDTQLHDIIEDTASDLYNATDVSVGPQRRHGLVQLAASDYDEIAYTNPQARLTYLDEDDGDLITIGSSFELAQRLDEPPPQTTDTEFPSTIHLFDIRRRQSITDLWKRFEHREHETVPELADTDVAMDDLDTRSTTLEADASSEQKSPVVTEQTNTTKDESSASFLSAFEAEMVKLMNQPQPSESNPEGASSSRTTETDSTPNLPRETAEAFASALQSLMEVAEAIRSGVKAKIPELERHLDSARRSLPSDITDSMRSAFQAVEAQVRAMASSLNGIPENIRREAGPTNARLFSELPTPDTVWDGLREISLQLGGMGQTLLDTLYDSSRGAFPAQYQNPFFNFPNFAEPSNQSATIPSDVGNPSSSHHGSAAGSAANENNPLSNVPENHPKAVPDFDQGSSESGSRPQQHSFYEQFPYRPPHQHPHVPRYLPTPHWSGHPFNHPAAPSAPPLFTYPCASPSSRIRHPPPAAPTPHDFSGPSRTLFIGNVGFEVTEKMVKDVFASKGLNVEVKLPRDSRTMKHAGFGYVTFSAGVEASLALDNLQGATIDGHRINLETTDHTPVSFILQEPAGQDPAMLASAPQTSGVIRRDANDDTLASAPDSAGPKPTGEKVYDQMVATAEARFPPVSQLEARLAAKEQHRLARTETRNVPQADETLQPREESATSSHIPGSFPQDEQDASSTTAREPVRRRSRRGPIQTRSGEGETQPELPEYSSIHHPGFPPLMVHPRHLHRAETTRMPDNRRSFDPFEPSPGLRRRATERYSLRHGPHMGPMGPRHRASFDHLSQPAPEQPLHVTTLSAHEEEPDNLIARREAKKQILNQRKQDALDECVARLMDMGFGTEEDGGTQRLSIYAAATNGDLFEAISMIEEEREAYNLRK